MNLPKVYSPADYEANTYALWETSGAFKPTGQGEPYSIVMPPPNANGNLHIGHALFVTLEDILTRYNRMRGYDTVWIPGADHAGFETWTVFEKALEAKGDSRFNHTRDELYQMTWDFVAENRGNMEMQLRALGASCDWNHQVFTLDRGVTDVVFTTFKKLWDDGLVYRGKRIVSYCTYHDTSFADIEVEYKDDKGKLWYIKYPLADSGVSASAAKQSSLDRHVAGAPREDGYITVATTRPETMLGDEAVAVNPNDKRYQKLIGKKLILPLVGKEIPIIADEAVEYDFGTGAVKVTPAHDPTDFDIGQRHDLPVTSVIGFDGLIIPPAPEEFVGLDIETARQRVIKQLDHLGLISKIEDFEHQVPHCYKCGRVIQPLVKDQWFVSVQPLAKKAISAIKQGKIKFTPQQKGEELIRYYEELRDWNISRQIPWGISIPAFRRVGSGHSGLDPESSQNNSPEWIFDTRVNQPEIEVDGVVYKRDEDTFDTWFSSGQWPYIVTRGDLERFYPTTVMETGFDILRAWVARMIMLGLYISDDVPFKEVYLHGLVNDEHNQKMSKSKGNVINPMDVVEEYGADAMRLGIIANRSAALSQAFSPATVVAGRNFCNKLWNIARYIETAGTASPSNPSETASHPGLARASRRAQLGAADVSEESDDSANSLAGHWVFRQLDNAREQVEKLLAEYRFAEAYDTVYHVIWDDVADWWLESTKLEASHNTKYIIQNTVLEFILKLAHPFAPFVTESIWQSLLSSCEDDNDVKNTTLLISQQWPEGLNYNKQKAADFEKVIEIVREVRRVNKDLGGGKRTLYYYGPVFARSAVTKQSSETNSGSPRSARDDSRNLIVENSETIKFLARLADIETGQSGFKLNLPDHDLYLSASDAEIGKYTENLAKIKAETEAKIKALEARLANKSYVANAPKELVEETRTELAKLKSLL